MKTQINVKYSVIHLIIYIIAFAALFLIYETRIDSSAVIIPSLISVAAVDLIFLRKKSIKPTFFITPAISGLLFSVMYILLSLRCLDPTGDYPFSNVIFGQCGNICVGIILSAVILLASKCCFKKQEA